MDIKIWERTIVAWLNSLNTSLPIDSINQINNSTLNEVIRKINLHCESSPVQFLKKAFPNLTESDSFTLTSSADYLCASTLLLIYVSLSKNEELKEIRELMCTKLDTSIQLSIVEFLNAVQEYESVFNLSFKNFKQDVFPQIFFNFRERGGENLTIGDGIKTPVKNSSLNSSFDSPLQGFFQTPKRSGNKNVKYIHSLHGDGDHTRTVKKLADQLAEEELEKAALQEKLNFQTHKCSEFELKLKNKIEEIKHLKEEWEAESKKNEEEMLSLKHKITGKLEIEKKLRNEVSYLESYLSRLESELSLSMSQNDKLENQLKEALEKITANEIQLKETTKLCSNLQNTIREKERDLENFKENYANFYNDEKAIDVSYMNGSFNRSISSPEDLGVVIDKLLSEKIEENALLQETISQLQAEKNELMEKVKVLHEKEALHSSAVSELQVLKDELNIKVGDLEKAEEELFKTQKELLSANSEIVKLNKENSHLNDKYNILNNKLQEREQVLIGCKNSKMLLQVTFLKLAEDLKIMQQRLEFEVRNISRLTCEGDKFPIAEAESKFADTCGSVQKSRSLLSDDTYDSFLSDEKFGKLAELLLNMESRDEWVTSKASVQKTIAQFNENIILLNRKIHDLEEYHEKSLEEKSKLQLLLEEAEKKIVLIQSSNSLEVQKLREALEEKESKIKELEKCIEHYKKFQEEIQLEKSDVMKGVKISNKEMDQKSLYESGDHKNIEVLDRIFSHTTENQEAVKNQEIVKNQEMIKNQETVENQEMVKNQKNQESEPQEFSDSLEEIPVPNKTFDIVNLEERNISDKTFSIKKEDLQPVIKRDKRDTAWIVSPPSKVPLKTTKEAVKRPYSRPTSGASWVVPIGSNRATENNVKKVSSSVNDLKAKTDAVKISELQTEIKDLSRECERLKNCFLESDQQRQKERELFEKNQETLRRNITVKYETQLEHLKTEMKQLYNRELAKHKHEQSSLNSELQDQNKRYKEHIDELRNQLWELGEKLLQEQTSKRDLKRTLSELRDKYEFLVLSKDSDMKSVNVKDVQERVKKEDGSDETVRASLRQMPNGTFPTIPTEDEDEVFDNRFLEDMKLGICKSEKPEDRLKELQYRNSLCLPHLKSSYPGETQFHNPALFKESELKFGLLQFTQESQSLTDSDQSMTKSLLPDTKGKKKEQTSYKRPGPPTPSKNGGRLSIHSGDVKLTPRNVLKEINDQSERNKATPNPLKLLLSSKGVRRGSVGGKDENMAPVTPRKKKFFRKPFGARDH